MFLRQHASFPEELAWYRLSRGQAMWPFDPEDVYVGIFGMIDPTQDPIPMTLWVAKIVQQLLGYRWATLVFDELLKVTLESWYTKDTVNVLVGIARSPDATQRIFEWLSRHNLLHGAKAKKDRFRWTHNLIIARWPHLSDDIADKIVDEANKQGIEAQLGKIAKDLGLSSADQRLCLAADIVQDLVIHGHNIPKDRCLLERLAVEIDLQQPLRDSLALLADRLIELDLLLSGLEQEHLNGLRLPNRSLILVTGFKDSSLDELLGDTPTLVELAELTDEPLGNLDVTKESADGSTESFLGYSHSRRLAGSDGHFGNGQRTSALSLLISDVLTITGD